MTVYGHLEPKERDRVVATGVKLLRLRNDRYVTDNRTPGDAYCWECGHIDSEIEFAIINKCPNPTCPRPENWND